MVKHFPILPTLPVLALLTATISGVIGLMALGGGAGNITRTQLIADINIQSFTLPATYGIDPTKISNDLSARMRERAEHDSALRLMLGADGRDRVSEVIIPRLVNAGVIRRMIKEMQSLGTIIAVGEFHGLVSGTLSNTGPAPMADVALTVPGALRAERQNGAPLALTSREDRVTAVTFGTLEPGAVLQFNVWIDTPIEDRVKARNEIRLGAAGNLDGQINIHMQSDWFGAELENLPWARWLIAAILAFTAFGAGATLILIVTQGIGRRNASRRDDAIRASTDQ